MDVHISHLPRYPPNALHALRTRITLLPTLVCALWHVSSTYASFCEWVAFSTLVHNPEAVEHFCDTIKGLATNGCVDCVSIRDFAVSCSEVNVGEFISVNAYVPV